MRFWCSAGIGKLKSVGATPVIIGAVFFAEPADPWVIAGGSVIILAVSFITWREAQLKRKHITPPTPATKV